MSGAEYVLCRWEKRLWPAKVLARIETSTKNKKKKEFFLEVQILSLKEKIRVKSSAVDVLRKSHIEKIAALLASQNEAPAAPLEELTYRRSLRVALDVLNQTTSLRQERRSLFPGEKLCTDVTSCVSNSLSPSFLPEDGQDGAVQAGPKKRQECPAQSSSTCENPKYKVGHKTGLGKHGDPRALPPLPVGNGSQDGSASQPGHGHETTATKRQRLGEKLSQRRRRGSCLSQGESTGETEGQAGRPVTPASLQPASGTQEDYLHVRVKDCDPSMPMGPGGMLPVPERGRGRPPKRPRRDADQNPPTMQLRAETGKAALAAGKESREPPAVHSVGDSDGPEEEDPPSPEESKEFSPSCSLPEDEDEDEDEEPPRILLYHEPRSFEVGMLVWLKYQKYPFWPAVVKSVRRRDRKASVLFIEGNMNPKGRGITVSLRRLKHFDCSEKHALLDRAKEDFAQAIGWCVSLITDYRVRLGCGSFSGSFLEYYAADISHPVRKSIQQDLLGTRFPQLGKGNLEKPSGDSPLGQWRPCRKVLPDRSRAARDRANQKLVEYIVKAKGAESHLRAILHSRKPSRWLKTFLSSGQYVTCVETYLEDEGQLDEVVEYLQGVCRDMDGETPAPGSGDRIRFILDVLLPEAIICAISAVDAVDYKTAEQKYIRGPTLSYREKEIFDNELLEERSRRRR